MSVGSDSSSMSHSSSPGLHVRTAAAPSMGPSIRDPAEARRWRRDIREGKRREPS